MSVKIVYRILRKISDWALEYFYSEVSVEGYSNVPPGGPLLLTPSHHNELMDIATLSVTIPHRRPISYWAKASMFANQISRRVMLSAGALPVHRKKNRGGSSLSISSSSAAVDLHLSTINAFKTDQAVAIFPEGTSYTEPGIIQVKEGAARVALEYVRWCRESSPSNQHFDKVVIVPVGIVYTDKAAYRSRVAVEYGEAIVVDHYMEDYCSSNPEESLRAIRQLCSHIGEKMKGLTINAADWSTLHSSQLAVDMIYLDTNQVSLRNFTKVSQRIVDLLSGTEIPGHVKNSLIEYHALLHHTGLSHAVLNFIGDDRNPTIQSVAMALVSHAARSLLSFTIFFPAFAAHVPAYLLATFAARRLAPRYLEARAQFKVVFGGIGLGAGCTAVAWIIWRSLKSLLIAKIGLGVLPHIESSMQMVLCTFGLAWMLCQWHNWQIDANIQNFRQLRAMVLVLYGLAVKSSFSEENLATYLKIPRPAASPHVKILTEEEEPIVGAIGSKLIVHLLRARQEATRELKLVEDIVKSHICTI